MKKKHFNELKTPKVAASTVISYTGAVAATPALSPLLAVCLVLLLS